MRRAPWLGRYARQLVADALLHVVLATLAGTLLFVIIDFVEAGNRAKDAAASGDFLWLSIYGLPRTLKLMVPVTAPLGVLTALGAGMRRLEVPSMLAAGAGPATFLKPVALLALALGLAYAALIEALVPPAAARMNAVRSALGILYADDSAPRQRWYRGGRRIYRVGGLEAGDGSVLAGVSIFEIAGGRLEHRIDVDRLEHDGGWRLGTGLARHLGEEEVRTERLDGVPIDLVERPGDFVLGLGMPSRMGYRALATATEIRERLGRPALEHRLELFARTAVPATLVAALLLAAGIALSLGRRQTLAAALGAGAALGFSVWLCLELGALLGAAGAVTPAIAAFTPPALYATLAALWWLHLGRRGIAE